jgi:hypothetical protein
MTVAGPSTTVDHRQRYTQAYTSATIRVLVLGQGSMVRAVTCLVRWARSGKHHNLLGRGRGPDLPPGRLPGQVMRRSNETGST